MVLVFSLICQHWSYSGKLCVLFDFSICFFSDISTLVLFWQTLCFQYYNFSLFAMMLNETTDSIRDSIPPTDCRLRPDLRKLEEGDIGESLQKLKLTAQ